MEVAEAFGVGVELTDSGIRLYLAAAPGPDRWREKLAGILADFRGPVPQDAALTYTAAVIPDEAWADNWKEHFKPLRIGRRLVVCPTWERTEVRPDELVVYLDPGRAFGTGHHETTRLCLEWLEKRAAGSVRADTGALLDVGTGSGILAMAAALLGYKPILALDVDPEAIEVAGENLVLNRLEAKVALQTIPVAAVTEHFDTVLANIQALPLIDLAGALTARLKPAGALVLSGILVEQQAAVRKSYEEQGLQLIRTEVAGEWCLLVFEPSVKV